MLGKLVGGIKSAWRGTVSFISAIWHSERLREFLYKAKVSTARNILLVGYPLRRLSWFLTRPHLEGAQCLVECQGRILLVRMNYGPDEWNMPGGGIHRGERPDAAAIREVVEETGLVLPHVYRIGCYDREMGYATERLYIYYGESPNAEYITDDIEIKEAKWFRPERIPGAVSDSVRRAMEYRDRFLAENTLKL